MIILRAECPLLHKWTLCAQHVHSPKVVCTLCAQNVHFYICGHALCEQIPYCTGTWANRITQVPASNPTSRVDTVHAECPLERSEPFCAQHVHFLPRTSGHAACNVSIPTKWTRCVQRVHYDCARVGALHAECPLIKKWTFCAHDVHTTRGEWTLCTQNVH